MDMLLGSSGPAERDHDVHSESCPSNNMDL